MVGKGQASVIVIQGGVTNGVANMFYHKTLRRVEAKMGQNTVVHTST